MFVLIYCFLYLPVFVGFLSWSLFWISLLCFLSSFALILTRKREHVALLLLFFRCFTSVNVSQHFLAVPWVGLL